MTRCIQRESRRLAMRTLCVFTLVGCATVAFAEPEDFGLTAVPVGNGAGASPPLPDPQVASVQLVLDDNRAESSFGFGVGSARQFMWFNRFTNPGRFELEEIWVLFPASMDISVGDNIQLVVYLDPDGDPTSGANLLATYDRTVQAANGSAFSIYPLSPPLPIVGRGDVLIGVVNRYYMTGIDPPSTLPAALDTTASQDRSYFALWAGDAPDPPDLATATVIDVLDGVVSGNFLIRGIGQGLPPLPVPTLSPWALFLLMAGLGSFAMWRLRRATI